MVQRKKISTPKALEALKKYNWTGNIRELRNVIERLVIMSAGDISEEDVKKLSLMMEVHNTILLYGIDVLLEKDKGEIYAPGVYIQ